MSSAVTSIIDEREASAEKPRVTVRQAGDRALLVEYGEMEFDLALNFFVLAMDTALRERPVDGLIETAPGFRSLLASYDPLTLPVGDLVDHLRAVYDDLPARAGIEIPSRLIKLPIAFSDTQTRAAVQRYIQQHPGGRPELRGRREHRLHRPLQRPRGS